MSRPIQSLVVSCMLVSISFCLKKNCTVPADQLVKVQSDNKTEKLDAREIITILVGIVFLGIAFVLFLKRKCNPPPAN